MTPPNKLAAYKLQLVSLEDTLIYKLTKLRRHSSQVHFASNCFGPIHFVLEHFRLYKFVFEHVGHHVHLHFGRHVGQRNVVLTLCEVSETLTEWKSQSITYQRTYGLTGIGARETCMSKTNTYFNRVETRYKLSSSKGVFTSKLNKDKCIAIVLAPCLKIYLSVSFITKVETFSLLPEDSSFASLKRL